MSYKFIADFEHFLRSYKPVDHQAPVGNNTVMKHIERLRKMINLAVKNEWLLRDPFAKFQARFQDNTDLREVIGNKVRQDMRSLIFGL